MNIVESIIHIIFKVFIDIVYASSLYTLLLSLFGIYKKKDKTTYDPHNRFAMVVAAHNEEKVIQDVVKSLSALDYPKDMYDIFVIADNCNDNTAQIAKEKGALVFERFNKVKKGKGYALEWMFGKIFKMEKKYDAVVVLDADNVVSKNFLREMNKKMLQGYKVVQGYVDSKNPKDTWITGAYSISFWTTNRMFQLARNNLKLSCQLSGTGCCISVEVLKKLGWGATCLTEDLEFTCKLIMNNYKVGWSHEAVIYDEKPLTLPQSWWQRKRWMQGFADVSSRYFFKLMKKSIKDRSFMAFDCAIYTIQPITLILFCLSTIIGIVRFLMQVVNAVSSSDVSILFGKASINISVIALGFVAIFQYVYTPVILALEKKFDFKVFIYYVIYPLYALTWLPISIQGILDKNKKDWNHTQHTRSISIEDLEKAN